MEAYNYWQSTCETVPDRVSYLLQSGHWSDCKFLVGTEPNQAVIHAHKMILAMASPVFEAMFFGELAERKGSISIPDIQPVTFKAMLRYIYSDKIEVNSFEEGINLYYAAKKYILPDVQSKCIKEIKDYLDIWSVCRAYEFASFFDEKSLKSLCLELMTNHTKKVINHETFKEAHLSTVISICSLQNVDCHELDLFEALERYVKAHEKRMESSTDCNNNNGPLEDKAERKDMVLVDVESAENRPETTRDKGTAPALQSTEPKEKLNIRPALEKIRFLVLTSQEFAEGPAKSGLLTQSEVLAILMNIASEKSHVPMPSGFSTSRQER